MSAALRGGTAASAPPALAVVRIPSSAEDQVPAAKDATVLACFPGTAGANPAKAYGSGRRCLPKTAAVTAGACPQTMPTNSLQRLLLHGRGHGAAPTAA